MGNIYSLFKVASCIKSQRLKLAGIAALHFMGKRYIGVFLDPVLACNFRCRMCYFSDEKKRREMQGIMLHEDIEAVARSLFHRALKLQIGCGAEPTLFKDLPFIVSLGKKYRIPYISLTTNGNLLNRDSLMALASAGLDEITLSVHGVKRETYEYLMVNGDYDKFVSVLDNVKDVKVLYPRFKLRINYTMNDDNIKELPLLFETFPNLPVDILQLRPIQKIGETDYDNFSLNKIVDNYDGIITPLLRECRQRNIVCLAPSPRNLLILEDNNTGEMISEATYCYVSPHICWHSDYDYRNMTFENYSRKAHIGKSLLKKVFLPRRKKKVQVTRKINYIIK